MEENYLNKHYIASYLTNRNCYRYIILLFPLRFHFKTQ